MVKSRLRPVLVALSVLLGVLLAAGGVAMARMSDNAEARRLIVPDTSYRPVVAPPPVTTPPTATPTPATTTAESPVSLPESTTTTSSPPTTTTSNKPAGSTKAAAPATDSSLAGQVLALVNQQRATAGCAALALDGRLTAAAQKHSDDMSARGYFSHTTPEGVTFDQRIKAGGYPSPGGENIAQGSTTATQTMTMWMNSDGHRRNILNCSFTNLGVGVATKGWYWTQTFGY